MKHILSNGKLSLSNGKFTKLPESAMPQPGDGVIRVRKFVNPDGSINPERSFEDTWAAIKKQILVGENIACFTLIFKPSGEIEIAPYCELEDLSEMVREVEAVAVIYIDETWIGTRDDIPPAQDPNRSEGLIGVLLTRSEVAVRALGYKDCAILWETSPGPGLGAHWFEIQRNLVDWE